MMEVKMDLLSNRALYTDLYELTMLQGYFEKHKIDYLATFEYHFRKNPFNGGYTVFSGIQDVLTYLKNLSFSKSDIDYLRTLGKFTDEFLKYLENFRFTGIIEFIPEGRVIFPYEPVVQIIAPLGQAQLIESALLNFLNYQTLIATKSSRIVTTAKDNKVVEFGLRRAHGDAAIVGARASVIGGCIGTSNVAAGKIYGIPVSGTHAHSWIMSFAKPEIDTKITELEAFRAYVNIYPNDSILLVDTYDTLESGVPNAITVGKELRSKGLTLKGIRIDSGDLVWLAVESAKMLDKEGFTDTFIVLSNDLDEFIIDSIQNQLKQYVETAFDKDKPFFDRMSKRILYGVGTSLITGSGGSQSALGGVYKLTEIDKKPVMKYSENIEKRTNPHQKNLWRISQNNEFIADVITLKEERQPKSGDLIHHNFDALKKSKIPDNCEVLPMYQKIDFSNQDEVKNLLPTFVQIDGWKKAQVQCQDDLKRLDNTNKRLINPHTYKVSLSDELFDLKNHLYNKLVIN